VSGSWRLLFLTASALLFVAPAEAEPPLSRLAALAADQISRVADGRAVELAPIRDRTGRGAAFAHDLEGLVLARLGRPPSGERVRLRVEGVLTETAERLVLSARVVLEPEGRLIDLVSASVDADPTLLALFPFPAPRDRAGIDLLASERTPPLGAPVLDLAFLPDDRLLVLFPDALALYRRDGSGLVREAKRPLPGPLDPVRAPGGVLVARDEDAWALTSGSSRASLFAVERHGLEARLEAEALPWPGSESGVRFRAGTNLIEARLPGLGGGPFLRPSGSDLAVDPEGRLLVGTAEGPRDTGVRAGPALTSLWPGVLAAASPSPPGEPDAILILRRDGAEVKPQDSLPVSGSIRALAGRVYAGVARLAAAVEDEDGVHLLFLDLRQARP
jgi:hypothetical protein